MATTSITFFDFLLIIIPYFVFFVGWRLKIGALMIVAGMGAIFLSFLYVSFPWFFFLLFLMSGILMFAYGALKK